MDKDVDFMSASLDRQISSAEQDAFGHRHFARALQSLLESGAHEPPFSVGLLGGWGTGKSTIKELYINDLRKDTRKNAERRTRSDRVRSITFNAWRFGGKDQDIKRALLRHVYLELGGDEDSLQDRLFRQVSKSHQELKGWRQYTFELIKAWAMPLPAFVASLLLLVGFIWLALAALPLETDLSRSLVAIFLTGAFSYLFKQLKSPPVAAHRPITRIDMPSASAEQYEDLLIGQLRRFKAGESTSPDGRNGKACERIVIFIDDLDRLSAEEMVLGLDAVRTFMEMPQSLLPPSLGLVFVISCDEAKVAHALAVRRRQGDMPGAVFSQTDARRYLDRIFQFRLEIPPFPRQDMRTHAGYQLRSLAGMEAELEAHGTSIETVVDRMVHVGVRDPRNALQIVNAFAQAWWLARRRETEELGTRRAGGLHEGAVTDHPVALGALSAIKVNFPDFYRDLQYDPSLLHRMTEVLIRGKSLESQPLAAQQMLAEHYFIKSDDAENPALEVLPQYRELRQFLASLIGVRWPDSLQSLLLLSEDPITRKFGSKASGIHGALVSGDTQGVLEGLGRHNDARLLNPDEARLLYQINEDLRNDSSIHRGGASRVIADLVGRLPARHARLLLGALCRELGDSVDLRSQLGVSKIASVLSEARSEDRRIIASRLVEDVLTRGQDMRLKLATMESPSLQEATEFARQTVTLALPIRAQDGLDASADRQLVTWLTDRTVKASGKETQLAFVELENWLSNHEEHLLPALEANYTEALADKLEDDRKLDFDPDIAIDRAQKVFEHLWNAGEESRPTLWATLTRYVRLSRPQKASEVAWNAMAARVEYPDADYISQFIAAFAARLQMGEEAIASELDLHSADSALRGMVQSRLTELSNAALESLAELAIFWSKSDATASAACAIANSLLRRDTDFAQSVFDEWCDRLLSDLPLPCIELVASEFEDLPESSQSKTIQQLKRVIDSDDIDEGAGERYRSFLGAASSDAWSEEPLREHLDGVVSRLPQRHGNPNEYLKRVFPALAVLLPYTVPSTLGTALQQLFAQAKNQPKHFAWLHSCMVGRWPAKSSDFDPYNPAQIFNDAATFAQNTPGNSSQGLLSSLGDLLTRGIVAPESRESLIAAACATWSAIPAEAVSAVSEFPDLVPEQAAALVDPIDWPDEESEANLYEAWSVIAKHQAQVASVQTTEHLLRKGLHGPEDEPDRGLRLWIDAQDERRQALLKEIIVLPELAEEHRTRLWRQVDLRARELGGAFFIDLIPKVLMLDSAEQTAHAIFENSDLIISLLEAADERADLAGALMTSFPAVSTKTVKVQIAELCSALSGDSSLQSLDPSQLTHADVDLLKSHFSARKLKQLRKQIPDD